MFVYYPFVHMIWGDGMLAQWGVRDFAGGIVVHTTAGWAALASVLYVGRRKCPRLAAQHPLRRPRHRPAVVRLVRLQRRQRARGRRITATAFLNTDIAASFAAVTWLLVEWRHARKPHFVGLLTGAVAGLATITPAAGFVPTWAAVVIGMSAGLVCYFAVFMQNKLHWDDALDVWGVHGVGGTLGIILLGVFAGTAINPSGAQGLIHGTAVFFGKEVAAGLGASAYAFLFTYGMLRLIDLITPVRVTELAERGLDEAMHGENAYDLDGEEEQDYSVPTLVG